MLSVQGLEAGYGDSRVLFGVGFAVNAGEVVTLLGRNGMGKTTTVLAVMGILRPRAGEVRLDGARLDGQAPYRVARAGLGLVPEGRQVFPNLTVRENLTATAAHRSAGGEPWTLRSVLDLFPPLAARLSSPGGLLSGGEQQMLAIGRALMTNPRLLILDEATEGLAPLVRQAIWEALARLKARGQAILVIDKNLDALTRIADRHYILEKGQVVWSGGSAELRANAGIVHRYLGL
ncbi:MAG TPA: ABC transporter ATP-binding protein [Acetobacteraceae bacterium]|nr:ABC transporter ATP-binding protein [Acetobacteraceae bacterium]